MLILLCILLGLGDKNTIQETVDLIELNHFYDDHGKHAYDQVIFYEWSPDYRRYHVIAWVLMDQDLSKMPTKKPNGKVSVRWRDTDNKVNREIVSNLYRETWGQSDPERMNKKLFDEKYRSSLIRVQKQSKE